jgi:hypothetical protein
MIAVDKSPLTGKIYRGFGKGNSWLYKVEV